MISEEVLKKVMEEVVGNSYLKHKFTSGRVNADVMPLSIGEISFDNLAKYGALICQQIDRHVSVLGQTNDQLYKLPKVKRQLASCSKFDRWWYMYYCSHLLICLYKKERHFLSR